MSLHNLNSSYLLPSKTRTHAPLRMLRTQEIINRQMFRMQSM
jgi:hypothetical protein